jgi:uncharacterized membrane protein YhdT
MENFALGLSIGYFTMWIIGRIFLYLAHKEKEKLRDFDTWKEWKNK